MKRGKVQSLVERRELGHLQRGELECLFLLMQQDENILLTDDLAVREAVSKLGGTPVGSLGIIVRAYRDEKIQMSEAERLLRELHEKSSLFVTEALVEVAIEQMREHL